MRRTQNYNGLTGNRFADRLLAELGDVGSGAVSVTAIASAIALSGSLAPVLSTDTIPVVRSGVLGRARATILRDYILGISGGIATIPESLTVTQNLVVSGNTTLGNATSDTVTVSGALSSTVASGIVEAFSTRVTADAQARWWVSGNGGMEWGGGSARDTNLYRNGAGELRTDGTFITPAITATAGLTLTATSATLALVATGANVITGSVNGTEALRVANITNATSTEYTLWNANGPVMGRIPLNATTALLEDGDGGRFATRLKLFRLGSSVGPTFRGNTFRGSWTAPTPTLAADRLTSFVGGGYDGSQFISGGEFFFRALEDWSGTALGTELVFSVKRTTTTSLTNIFAISSTASGIANFTAGSPVFRVIPGSTSYAIRDSANTLDAATFNAAGTLLTLNQDLTLGGNITTGAPSGAAAAWRLGSLITAAVTPDTTRYLEVSAGGTVYKVIIST